MRVAVGDEDTHLGNVGSPAMLRPERLLPQITQRKMRVRLVSRGHAGLKDLLLQGLLAETVVEGDARGWSVSEGHESHPLEVAVDGEQVHHTGHELQRFAEVW